MDDTIRDLVEELLDAFGLPKPGAIDPQRWMLDAVAIVRDFVRSFNHDTTWCPFCDEVC